MKLPETFMKRVRYEFIKEKGFETIEYHGHR